MSARKRESGAKYKKIRAEKEEKEAALLKKVPKLEKFFGKKDADAGRMFSFLVLYF